MLIIGEKDRTVDWTFMKNFRNIIINRMGHLFFGYEDRIADAIKSNIE